jgi:16S rRNA (cytidine1402-2'-O)-methyltransferase
VIAAGLRVEPVPGASAVVAALTASGLSTEEFHFVGFLPHKSGQRRTQLERLKTVTGTLVLYESPYRVVNTLQVLSTLSPALPVVVCRELTKKFEEVLRGTAEEVSASLAQRKEVRGEFVIVGGTGIANPEDAQHTS